MPQSAQQLKCQSDLVYSDPIQWTVVVQDHGLIIELQLGFQDREEALLHCVVPAAALGRHAAADLVVFELLPVGRYSVLARLFGVWIRSCGRVRSGGAPEPG